MNEQQVREATTDHINVVRSLLLLIRQHLSIRGYNHDMSKLHDPEFPIFMEYTPKLATSTYGSDEYKRYLQEMKPALDHHYAVNRHHPEYHKDGINDMNLVDIIEMLCDWKAATLRHNNGDIMKSIEINKDRFGLSEQLVRILQNTVEIFDVQT